MQVRDKLLVRLTAVAVAFWSAAIASPSRAAIVSGATLYVDRASFDAAVGTRNPPPYTEDFNTTAHRTGYTIGANHFARTATYSDNGFTYTATAPGPTDDELYLVDILSTQSPDSGVTVTFDSGNVTAVGGNFFFVDYDDNVVPGQVSLAFADGSSLDFNTSTADAFVGLTSDKPIASFTLAAGTNDPNGNVYSAIDNLTVAGTVPEPASAGLAFMSIALALGRRRGSVRHQAKGEAP